MNQELENTSIAQYYHKIESGEIIACRKIKTLYRHLYYKLYHPAEFHFDIEKAQRPIRFIEKFCKHSKGAMGGKSFKLELWQKAMTESAFGFVDDRGMRQYKEMIFYVARKNGKSMWASAVALYMLIADCEAGPEIVSAATKKDQAKIIWSETVKMIKKSPDLRNIIKCKVAEIDCDINEGNFKPVSSESNSLDGLNLSCWLIDELHAIKDKNLYYVIRDATSAREQSLGVITTTAGTVREGIFDLKYEQCRKILKYYENKQDPNALDDERTLPVMYELDSENEWKNEKMWVKANPGLGTIKKIEQIRDKVKQAKSQPVLLTNLLTKDFNINCNAEDAFLNFSEVKSDETYDVESIKGKLCIGGFDLSQTTDLTSAVILVKQNDKYYILSKSWMPEDVFQKRMHEDKVPYDLWINSGYLDLCQGNKINYTDVYNWFVETTKKYNLKMYRIGYDPYSAQYLVDDLRNYYGKDVLDEVRQGTKTLSLPLQELKAEFQKKNIIYNNNPLFCWCLCNLRVKIDANGGYNTIKNRNGKVRDDAAMALLDAYTSYLRNKQVFDYYNK